MLYKRTTFTTAISEDNVRKDLEVKGISFNYKGINVGIFNAKQIEKMKSGFTAIVITKNKTNGLKISDGRTQKEAITNVINLIDINEKTILRLIGDKENE